jgi:UDP-N-acetylmuramoyl-tripeptide--D-alanyl-D-alanine ligase
VFTLADCLEAITGIRPENANLVITEAAIDSRQVIPGGLFVALPGEHVDGHDFVADAFKRHANLALVQRDLSANFPTIDLRAGKLPEPLEIPAAPFCLWVNDSLKALQQIAGFWRRQLKIRVIGITGSVGKSTTKELVAEVLGRRFRTLKNLGNLNNEIGLPLSLLRLSRGHERAVLEMGFYVTGEIKMLCELALPQVGVVTNVGTVHAERAGSQEVIAQGKAELVEALPPAPTGIAILNYDDPWVRKMADKTRARILFYGLDPHAHLWADNIDGLGLEGIRFDLHFHNEVINLRVPLIGRHSVHTALRAAAVGLAEGLTWQDIASGLRTGNAQLRLVAVNTPGGALLLDDTYNASPESTLAALNLLSEMEGRKIAVLGDMLELGPYEQQSHEMVGLRASEVAQELVLLGERARIIASAASQSGMKASAIHWFEDINHLIEYLSHSLKAGDVALVKGSHSMHMERIVAALETSS